MRRLLRICIPFVVLAMGFSTAKAQEISLKTPTVGSTFHYEWSYGGLESYTVISTDGGRLRVLLEQDFENDGTVDQRAVQYWHLSSRLWLAHMGNDLVNIYTPKDTDGLPTAVYDGLYFDGDFNLFTTDGLGDFTVDAAQVNSACDFFLLADPVETEVGTFEAMEMNCVDTDLDTDGTQRDDPDSQYFYAEIWSLELGMPVYQYFGVDQETGDVDDFAMLVNYTLN